MQETELFQSRMTDLAKASEHGGYYTATHFLTLAEQAELKTLWETGKITHYTLDGGFDGAERKYALFGDPASFGYEPTSEALWLKIAPRAPKFADALTHRDFLGSLMALGIKRELLGDILIIDNVGYLYLLESIAPYITDALTRIRHTDVTVETVTAPPQSAVALPDVTVIVASSERLDATVAAVYKLSREKTKAMIEKELCFVDGRATTKPDIILKAGATVSLRGFGRFHFDGVLSDTKKGKLRIAVRIFS